MTSDTGRYNGIAIRNSATAIWPQSSWMRWLAPQTDAVAREPAATVVAMIEICDQRPNGASLGCDRTAKTVAAMASTMSAATAVPGCTTWRPCWRVE